MNTPFTRLDFLNVFARYNQATWPATFGLMVIALIGAIGVARHWRYSDRWASGVLAALWLWSGVGFHLAFFADVNPAAIAFGVLFIAQGLGFLRQGVLRHEIVFNAQLRSVRGLTGLLVMTYAIAVYPLTSAALEHRWPQTPTFGAPCPIDLFTLGLLLWTTSPVARLLLTVPLSWALMASVGAWEFEMHEDWALTVAAVIAAAWLWPRRHERESQQPGRHVTAVSHRVWKHASRISHCD